MPDNCTCTNSSYREYCQYFKCVEQFNIEVNTSEPIGYLWAEIYPGVGYVPDQNCTWNLTVETGYLFKLTLETYQIAKGDIVKIDDEASNQQIFQTDSDDSTIFIETKRNSILIHFITDSVFNGTGFNLTYEAVAEPTNGTNPDLTMSGYFETTGGLAASYGNDADEEWLVQLPSGSVFLVDVQMGSGGIDASDLLRLTDTMMNETMTSSAIALGPSSLTQLVRVGNSFSTTFLSDSTVSSTGFRVSFQEWIHSFSGCPFPKFYTTSSGTFYSENYPEGRYSNNLNCTWLITVISGKNVWLTLTVGTLEPLNDIITIYDGADSNATILFQTTDSNFAIPLMSTGNSVLVSFTTDGAYTAGTGFLISYRKAQLWPSLSYLGAQSASDWDFTVTHGSTLIDGITGNILLVPTSDLSEGVMWALVVN